MNSCLSGNGLLWLLIILLILNNGGGLLNSSVLTGCGWPIALALGYCLYKNGTLGTIFGQNNGCGCNN